MDWASIGIDLEVARARGADEATIETAGKDAVPAGWDAFSRDRPLVFNDVIQARRALRALCREAA